MSAKAHSVTNKIIAITLDIHEALEEGDQFLV